MPRISSESNSFNRGSKYVSTERFSEKVLPRPHSDYAGGYMDWDEDSDEARKEKEAADASVRSDEQIEAAVKGALNSEYELDFSQIDAQVIKGVVLLTGQVLDEKIKTAAERRVGNIPGIREVKNQLHFNPR